MNILALALVEFPREELGESTYRSAYAFYDFIVDGESLRETLRTLDIGVLSPAWPSVAFARGLLNEEMDPLLDGRATIYGCRECLDILCGGISVVVSSVGDRIMWSDISRYDMDWGNAAAPTEAMNYTPKAVGPFEFDASEYRALIAPFAGAEVN